MSVVSRPISTLPPGTALARLAIVRAKMADDPASAVLMAESLTDSPQVLAAVRHMVTKAGVGPNHSQGFDNAEMVSGIAREAVALERGMSVFGAALSKMRQVAFLLASLQETGAASGGWVGEGKATPLRAATFDNLRLQPFKAQAATVWSKEGLRFTTPAQAALSNGLVGNTSAVIDDLFLNPTYTATADGPASITNGATEITSTGGTAPTQAQLTANLGSMIDAITTSGRGLAWVMQPRSAARSHLVLGAASDLPRTLLGLPVIVSATSPRQIALIDFNEIAYADDGGFELDVSTQGDVEMSDAPTSAAVTEGSPSDDPVAASMVSLWQSGLVAFRVTRWLNWQVLQSGAVAYMTVSY